MGFKWIQIVFQGISIGSKWIEMAFEWIEMNLNGS